MRTPGLGSVFFTTQEPPADPAQLQRYLQDLEQRIFIAVTALAAGHLDKLNAAPEKPREGDIRFADGTNWNPGSGKGIYAYSGAAWVLIKTL